MRWRIALNMSQGTVVTTSLEMLGRTPGVEQLERRRQAMAHLHLEFRRDRGGAAGLADDLELPSLIVLLWT